jgi:hypothetical protein
MRVRANNESANLRGFVIGLFFLAAAGAAVADLMVTNGAGVRAGITGILYRQMENEVAVKYAVSDPTGTNTTTFVIQRSSDLTNWVDASQTVNVIGSISAGEFTEFATNSTQFYRMRLINFQ